MVQTIHRRRKTAFTDLMDRDRPAVLDGGLATQLEAQGCDIRSALWSASLLQSNPAEIVRAHRAYIDAGAECIATASYQASRQGYAEVGISDNEADKLIELSVTLAKIAREEADSPAAIAASLGPYGAMLHDGSEYHGNYGVTADVIRAFHRPRLQLLDAVDVDVLALETIPSRIEAEVLSELLAQCRTPAWISFSCSDGEHICDGTPICDVAKLFIEHPTVIAIGVNCTPPQFVPDLLHVLRRSIPDKHLIAYPNSGENYNADDNSWSGTVTPGDCAVAAGEWINAGAKMVGGCCRMGPEHIRAIEQLVR